MIADCPVLGLAGKSEPLPVLQPACRNCGHEHGAVAAELARIAAALDGLRARLGIAELPGTQHFLPPQARAWVTRLAEMIAYEHGVPVETMLGGLRNDANVRPRFIYVWVLRQVSRYSLPQIAQIVSRDHSSVLHAVRRVDEWRKADDITREHTDALVTRASAMRQQAFAAARQPTQPEETDHGTTTQG